MTFAAAGAVAWGGWKFVRAEFPDVSVLRNHYPVVRYNGPDDPLR